MFGWDKVRVLTYGFLLGTAGVKLLTSADAKKAYTQVTAAALRCADETVRTANLVKESCDDIVAEAKAINERRQALAREREIADAKAVIAQANEAE